MAQRKGSATEVFDETIHLLGPWFEALARGLKTGVVIVDGGGHATFWNTSARELLGIDPEGGPPAEQIASLVPERLRGGAARDGAVEELEFARPSGRRRRITVTVREVEGADCGHVLVLRDRERTAALEASLALASRVRTWSVLRAQIHDLKAPLNALSLNVELLHGSLTRDEADSEEAREEQLASIDVLRREIRRLGRALEEFLNSAPRDSGSGTKRVALNPLLKNVARLMRPAARAEGIEVRVDPVHPPVRVRANTDRLKQALLNVVLNAIEAMDAGGEVRLRVARDAERARILVEDDGPGIPPELVDRVFEMNFSTKSTGTGIGLTVARSLIKAQGGTLELHSALGEGTTVEIAFPIEGK